MAIDVEKHIETIKLGAKANALIAKKRAEKRAILMLVCTMLVLALTGCTKYVVRDPAVYQTELNQYDAWATKQAALLKGFVGLHCTCDSGKFTTKRCADSADFILTIEARHEWHKAMSLHLAGITEDRPPKVPPKIPASSTLCPAPAPAAAAPAEGHAPAPEGGK